MALTDSLVAYYSFDEGSGTTYHDATGNGHNATLTGTGIGWGTGKVGAHSASFAGSGGYAVMTALTGVDTWTWAGWVNANTYPGGSYQCLSDNGNNGIYVQGSSLTVYNSGNQTDTTSLTVGVWYHLAVVQDNSTSTMSFYINGAFSSSLTSTMNFGPACMGGQSATGGGFTYNGYLDELGFWSRVLSGTEIAALYNGGSGLAYPFAGTVPAGVGAGLVTWAGHATGVTPPTVPGTPTGVTAVAGVQQATITFTPPASNGGATIDHYTITSSPGGFTTTVYP